MPLVIRKEYLFLEFWWKLVGGKKSILAIRKLPFQPSSFASSYICLLVGSDPWVRPIFHRLNLTHPLGSIPRQSSFKIVNNDNVHSRTRLVEPTILILAILGYRLL